MPAVRMLNLSDKAHRDGSNKESCRREGGQKQARGRPAGTAPSASAKMNVAWVERKQA